MQMYLSLHIYVLTTESLFIHFLFFVMDMNAANPTLLKLTISTTGIITTGMASDSDTTQQMLANIFNNNVFMFVAVN